MPHSNPKESIIMSRYFLKILRNFNKWILKLENRKDWDDRKDRNDWDDLRTGMTGMTGTTAMTGMNEIAELLKINSGVPNSPGGP